jgi:hypothetical protein
MIDRTLTIKLFLFLAVPALFFSVPARADQVRKLLEFRCDPSGGEFVVVAFLNNDTPSAWDGLSRGRALKRGKSNFFLGDGSVNQSCRIGAQTIRAKVWYPTKGEYLDCKRFGLAILKPVAHGVEAQLVHDCMKNPVVELRYNEAEGWRRCDGDHVNLQCQVLAGAQPRVPAELRQNAGEAR